MKICKGINGSQKSFFSKFEFVYKGGKLVCRHRFS